MFYAFLWLGGHLIDLLVSLFERDSNNLFHETSTRHEVLHHRTHFQLASEPVTLIPVVSFLPGYTF